MPDILKGKRRKAAKKALGTRDYDKEYREFHGKPEQIKNRSKRNMARRKMEKEGRVTKGDGNEVDHIISMKNGGGNGKGNTRVVKAGVNRRKGSKNG
jgi:hypothetical protein|tara:strand:+ start:30 stop:320 length:291 start_codon:yes stop_codon:yes gene_type:complete